MDLESTDRSTVVPLFLQRTSKRNHCSHRGGVTLLFFILMTLGLAEALQAQVFVTRDYLSGVTLARGQFEVSADYLVMNETVDLLNLRQSRIEKTSTALRSDGLGDLKGAQVMAAYGLRDNMMISGSYHYRQLNVTFADLDVDGYALSISRRYNLYQRPDALAAYLLVGDITAQCSATIIWPEGFPVVSRLEKSLGVW